MVVAEEEEEAVEIAEDEVVLTTAVAQLHTSKVQNGPRRRTFST